MVFSNKESKCFVTCPAGLEGLVHNELVEFGAADVKETVTGVFCRADLEVMYKMCLWSRFANRVLLVLAEGESGGRDALYKAAASVPWQLHIHGTDTIRVDFAGSNDEIRHTQFGAQVVKDAIVDTMVEEGQSRPNVDLEHADHRINVRLSKRGIYVALDLSGESLHKRGYRFGKGAAPIKENLAAGLLARANWPGIAKQGGHFVDPMCGSATFLIEAAMMAADTAPGLLRKQFGFTQWRLHDDALWQSLIADALTRKEAGLAALKSTFIGCEQDGLVVDKARKNIRQAGFGPSIRIDNHDFRDADFSGLDGAGLLMSNPPYGMRLGDQDKLAIDYKALADVAKQQFPGWQFAIISSNPELLAETRLRADKKYKVYNGAIPCELRLYSLKSRVEREQHETLNAEKKAQAQLLSEGALMVSNRIKKNMRKLKSWRQKNNIECYRVYDADLPEYAAAIDYYAGEIHVQEYEAPKTIDANKARQRLQDIVRACEHVFNKSKTEIALKTRRVNKGLAQYEKQAELDPQDFVVVKEGRASVLVNLKSYLDTGLFLDHRPLRLRIAGQVRGKRFLNLFSYTSTASVHAVLGGAASTTSVDMSNTYIAWSQLNFDQNAIGGDQHQLIRANVITWLASCREGYDVIMLDPPSFSNSKKMDDSFDVQRDHVALVKRCMDLLNPGGTLFFSNNLRKFKLDTQLQEQYSVANITPDTIDPDFARHPKIHHCFKIESP